MKTQNILMCENILKTNGACILFYVKLCQVSWYFKLLNEGPNLFVDSRITLAKSAT